MNWWARLTENERSIVTCITLGWHNPAIAVHEHRTLDAIKKAILIIFDKVGCDSRLELALWNLDRLTSKPKAEFARGVAA